MLLSAHLSAYSEAARPGVTSPAAIMCGWLSGAGCASTRRCEKALCQAAPGLRKRDARLIVARPAETMAWAVTHLEELHHPEATLACV